MRGGAAAVELLHARHRLRHVEHRPLDDPEPLAERARQALANLEQGLQMQRGGRDRVVDVVGDAARHLAEGPQPVALEGRLAGLAEVVVGLLEGAVQLRLEGGQGDVVGQLGEELAFALAEGRRVLAGHHQQAEDLVFGMQRRHRRRLQAEGGQMAKEGHVGVRQVVDAHRLAVQADLEPGGIEAGSGAVAIEQERRPLARLIPRKVASSQAPPSAKRKIPLKSTGSRLLEAAHRHLEDAGGVLALGGRPGHLLQQIHPLQLVEGAGLGRLAQGVGAVERGGRPPHQGAEEDHVGEERRG